MGSISTTGWVGVLLVSGLVACGGGDGGGTAGSSGDPGTPPPGSAPPAGTSPDPATTPPPDLPAPTIAAGTFDRFPGESLVGHLDAQGATDVVFEVVTAPKSGRVGWIDATKGDFLYRPSSLTSAVADEVEIVAKGNGKTSAPMKVAIGIKPLDFTKPMDVRGAVNHWYSYNLSINFNNAGSTACGDQQLTIAAGNLAQRTWGCGTFPEIAVSVAAGGLSGAINGTGDNFRKVRVVRKQLDARLAYEEESTDCSSYNSTLKSCNAGLSENMQDARVYLGAAPTTTTPPVMKPSRCETTGQTPCEGFLLASDAEADLLSFQVATPAANGNVTIDQTLKGFYYTAKPGFVGTDTFTITASDGPGTSAPATITVVVK